MCSRLCIPERSYTERFKHCLRGTIAFQWANFLQELISNFLGRFRPPIVLTRDDLEYITCDRQVSRPYLVITHLGRQARKGKRMMVLRVAIVDGKACVIITNF